MMDVLKMAGLRKATDVHVEAGGVAYLRVLGALEPLGAFSAEDFRALQNQLFLAASIVNNGGEGVKDFSCAIPGLGRLRVRCYQSRGREAMAIRLLPAGVPAQDTLQWPPAVAPLCACRQGLILVTGASGSGKSTTLAAMIELINHTRPCHILTFEAPIEYLFQNDQAMIHQCEVPTEVASFAEGAKDALRMDADVIMLGELGDLETMRAAMKLAESGHLVLATMHIGSASEAVGYFINHFPADEQPLVAHQLAAMLQAVITQRLLTHVSAAQRVPVYEVMLHNTAVARQIRERDYAQLAASIELGRAEGMVLLEDSLASLVCTGTVALDDALAAANDPARLRRLLR